MVYTVTSYLIAGVCVPTDELYEEVKVRGCAHAKTGAFCSKCGKPKYVSSRQRIQAFKGDVFEFEGTNFDVVSDYARGVSYIGDIISTGSDDDSFHEDARGKLIKKSARLDKRYLRAFFYDRPFGLWLVTICS